MVIDVISLCAPGCLILCHTPCLAFPSPFCARCVWGAGGRLMVGRVWADQFSPLSLWDSKAELLKPFPCVTLHPWALHIHTLDFSAWSGPAVRTIGMARTGLVWGAEKWRANRTRHGKWGNSFVGHSNQRGFSAKFTSPDKCWWPRGCWCERTWWNSGLFIFFNWKLPN